MIKIIDKRSTGKTLRLMLIAKENNATFVCSNPYAMMEKARYYGIAGIHFISYHDFIYGSKEEKTNFVIDEIDNFINFISTNNWNLIGYTDCNED